MQDPWDTPGVTEIPDDTIAERRALGLSDEDRQVIEESVLGILRSVGEDPAREGLVDTPKRVRRMYEEQILAGYNQDPAEILHTTFHVERQEMILVKDIPFYSMCEHHMLPFAGLAHVGYIPKERIVGISKIARLVECFTRRLQIQERLVSQIADSLDEHLSPLGVAVVISAEHMCMTMRGVQKPGSKTVTSAMRGLFFYDGRARAEFLQLVGMGRADGYS
jgi:GTP cyclohydrolase I